MLFRISKLHFLHVLVLHCELVTFPYMMETCSLDFEVFCSRQVIVLNFGCAAVLQMIV